MDIIKTVRERFPKPRDIRDKLVGALAQRGFYLDRSEWEWGRLHNMYKGHSGFIIGNGPSLRIEDLDRIADQITIASNKMFLAYEKTRFRPTILTFIDLILVENIVEELRALPGKKYFADTLREIIEPMPGAIYWTDITGAISRDTMRRKFSTDARKCIYAGHTVTYNNMQIAYHLGLKTVYLIGMDFHFKLPEKSQDHFYAEALISDGEQNHFIPNYRKPGEMWSMPDLERQKGAFLSAKDCFEADGRMIYNATRGGKLEVFPRVDLDEVIGKLKRARD